MLINNLVQEALVQELFGFGGPAKVDSLSLIEVKNKKLWDSVQDNAPGYHMMVRRILKSYTNWILLASPKGYIVGWFAYKSPNNILLLVSDSYDISDVASIMLDYSITTYNIKSKKIKVKYLGYKENEVGEIYLDAGSLRNIKDINIDL